SSPSSCSSLRSRSSWSSGSTSSSSMASSTNSASFPISSGVASSVFTMASLGSLLFFHASDGRRRPGRRRQPRPRSGRHDAGVNMETVKRIAPIFPVRDLGVSLAHYGRLGFATREYEVGGYGFLTLDGVEIHLG